MSKKFLTKVVLATVLASGINLLPTPNFDAGNVQISVAYAESKNFAAKEAAMTDVEIIEAQAKEASRLRAIEAVKEKIASYVRNFSGAKGKLNEDDIAAIAEKFEEVGEAKYKKLFYNAVDEEGKELGKVGIMYEATVTAKFNSKKITEYIKLTEQEKARRIRQAREAREKFEELDREYEELRKNARTKTPEQLQSDIKIFDDKISDLEKSRGKNKSVKKDKQTTQKDKVVSNVPLKFLKTVQIGEVTLPPMGFFDIKKADYHNGTPCTEKDYEHLGLYAKGIARFGSGDDALYFHYDANNGHYNGMISRFGSQDFKNTVEDFPGIPGIVWHLKTNSGMKFYIIEHGNAAGFGSSCTLIGENKDGKFVKYFNTKEIKDRYLGERNHRGISDEWNKFTFQDNTIIIRYGQYGSYNKFNAIGEFRFKWDEKAQWFGVEQVIYNQIATEQKPTQENKPVTNQPMQFSQPVYIGHAGSIAYIGQDRYYKGGVFIKGSSYNDGNILRDTGNSNIGPEYGSGTAIWGNGKDALYCKYECYDWYDNSVIAQFRKQKLSFGGKNQYIFSDGTRDISKINTNNGITLYALYYRYKLYTDLDIIGCRQDGKWVIYIDMNSIIEKYFGPHNKRKGEVIIGSEVRALSEETQKYIHCKGDTIIIPYVTVIWHPNEIITKGEFRFKWDEKAQWFSVEQVKY